MLGVAKDASAEEIRAAYRRRALQMHPDRNRGKEDEAKERFQQLQKVYAVLSDPAKRKVYDRTGRIDDADELAGEKFDQLYEYYRTMYREVTEEDVLEFEAQYRGSEEEKQDLFKYYRNFQGRMDKVFAWLMCSRPEADSHRFRDWIEAEADCGNLERYPAYKKWVRGVNKKPAPKDPLRLASFEKKSRVTSRSSDGDGQDLAMMIRNRGKDRSSSLLASLEAKYAPASRKRKPRAPPTEVDFEAARARLASRPRVPR